MNPPPYGRAAMRRVSERQALHQALALLRQGEVIALPTDSVYGFACDCLNPRAVARLRDGTLDVPRSTVWLHLSSERQLLDVARDLPDSVWEISAQHWPGALTLMLLAAPILPQPLMAERGAVAVCLPSSRLVRVLAAGLERPLAIAGVTPGSGINCRSGEEVFAHFSTSVPLILDGGHLPGDRHATVLDLTTAPPIVRQEGSITREMLTPWLQ